MHFNSLTFSAHHHSVESICS